MAVLRVAIEGTPKKTFASALDWPGWSRSGKTEEDAVSALLAYADRYRPVVERAGLTPRLPHELEIVDRLPGDMTTQFGAPGQIHAVEYEPMAADEDYLYWSFEDKIFRMKKF